MVMSGQARQKLRIDVQHTQQFQQLLDAYNTPEEAFQKGDYTIIPKMSDVSPETLALAYIMLGNHEKGLALLDRRQITGPKTDLYRAYALWCLNRNREAKALLNESHHFDPDDPRPAALSKLLEDGPIPVMLLGSVSVQVIPFLKACEGFEVTTVGFGAHYDIPLQPGEEADRTVCELTDKALFSLSIGPEFFSMPAFYAKLEIPRFAFILDYDVTLASKRTQMAAHDHLLVYASGEHQGLARFHPQPIQTFAAFTYTPDIFRHAKSLAPDPEKLYDLFFTGYAFDAFFPDKARVLFKMATMDTRHRILINHNRPRLSAGEYVQHLASGRFIPTFIRMYGSISTRAVETLHCHSRALVQRGSFMNDCLLEGREDGIFEYGYEDMESELSALLDGADEQAFPEPPGERVKQLFSARRGAGNLLKLCAFTSILNRAKPKSQQWRKVPEHRAASCGMHHEYEADMDEFHRHVVQANLDPGLHNRKPDLVNWLNATAALIYQSQRDPDHYRSQVDTAFKQALGAFPDSMALCFNYARYLYHDGRFESSKTHFSRLVADAFTLYLDPLRHDLLNGLAFHQSHFPYAGYIEEMGKTRNRDHGEAGHENWGNVREVVVAGACYYLGLIAMARGACHSAAESAERATASYAGHFPAHLLAGNAFWACYRKSPSHQEYAKRAFQGFDCAFSAYPFFLHEHLAPAVRAAAASGEMVYAKDLIVKWFRFYQRARINFECLPLQDDVFALFEADPTLFDADTTHFLQRMNHHRAFILSMAGAEPAPLEPFQELALVAYLKAHPFSLVAERAAALVAALPANQTTNLSLYLAEAMLERGQHKRAVKALSAYLNAAKPQYSKVYFLTMKLVEQGYKAEAANLFERLLESGYDRPWLIHYHLGELVLEDDPEAARQRFRTALDQFPGFIKARKQLEALEQS